MVSQEQRRRQLAREKFLRQQQRRTQARRKARMRNTVIASVLTVAVLGAGGAYAAGAFKSDDKKDTSAASTASPSPSVSSTEKPEPKMAIDAKATYTMTIKTNQGDVNIAMDAAKTPHTVNSFKYLADKGFFNNTKCHRLTTEGIYVLQCGDPQGTGAGGPGYTIPDENLNGLGKAGSDGSVTYPAGTVAMANTGQPHTGGSQFFLVYKDSKLPPSYTPFGKMDAAGLKAVEDIAKNGVASGGQSPSDGAPKKTVKVQTVTVKKD
ncbi:peptidylprolyl isomerase [Streptomyces monashensis]|uniref:Peptidylprolyl isomerase n=1 Tax=Streptomyces monashensis TaxID=1678012 RepID=A0A1S2QGS5_9ACTN|nr:peptidylprolyl isomerase [Streptomyces monashensis]OIK05359.1 peptidylprolyl isomerase [Streptomyces monashensis]